MATVTISDQVETLIDRYGLERVLLAMTGVAHDKAVHVIENWQDVELAGRWTRAGDTLDICQARVKAIELP